MVVGGLQWWCEWHCDILDDAPSFCDARLDQFPLFLFVLLAFFAASLKLLCCHLCFSEERGRKEKRKVGGVGGRINIRTLCCLMHVYKMPKRAIHVRSISRNTSQLCNTSQHIYFFLRFRLLLIHFGKSVKICWHENTERRHLVLQALSAHTTHTMSISTRNCRNASS